MATTTPIDEITIDLQATVWKFGMERGYSGGYLDADGGSSMTWYDTDRYVMTLVESTSGKARTLACFYEEDDLASWVGDLFDDNGGSNAMLTLPWEIFCRSVERLAAAAEGTTVSIPGSHGTLRIVGEDVIYTTQCRAFYRLSRAALEALAR